jgi:hypothetical protein
VRDPRATYGRFDVQIWRDEPQAELRASGLPGAIQRNGDSAWISALLGEADTIIRQLRKMSNVQEYVLFLHSPPSFDFVLQTKAPEARRTKDDYNSGKRGYDQAHEQFQAALDTWNREEHIQENRLLLERASVIASQRAYGFIGQAIERTLQDWRPGDIQSEDRHLGRDRGVVAGEKGVSVLGHPALTKYTQQMACRA